MMSCRFAIWWVVALSVAVAQAGPLPKIVLETDMESDIDDAAALAILHALADNGECELLAVMHNTSDPYGVGVIDAINTYYGRGDLPIGAYQANDAPSANFGGAMHYAEKIAKNPQFPKDVVSHRDVPDALTVYRQVLARQSDKSVTIVSVGWLTNLKNLLLDEQGRRLVQQKVRRLVVMGGRWDPTDTAHVATMNLAGNQIVAAAYDSGKYIVDHWPTEIVFSGLSIGGKVLTGEKLKSLPPNNPVREAYRICKKRWRLTNWNHASWDQTAALFAVRGPDKLWKLNSNGTPRMFLKPNIQQRCLRWNTMWDSKVDSNRAYMRFATAPNKIATIIEQLMIQPPRDSHPKGD